VAFDRRAADAVEPVAAGDDVALDRLRLALVDEADPWPGRLDAGELDILDLEQQRAPTFEPVRDQVLDDLCLAVDRDRATIGKIAERDPVTLALELQVDSVVDDSLAVQPFGDAGAFEQLHGALFEQPRPDPPLHVVAATVLEHDRFDSRLLEQPREQQPGRPGADDRNLGSYCRRAHTRPRPRGIGTPAGAASSCAIWRLPSIAGL
jgi:hypothetical protein